VKDDAPTVEVIGDRDNHIIIPLFKRQQERSIFDCASAVWLLARRWRLIEVLVCIDGLAVDEDPGFADPSKVDLLGLFLVGMNGGFEPGKG